MTQLFAKPTVGSNVTVTTDYSSYMRGFASGVPRTRTYQGQVVKSASYDDPLSFRMTTGDPSYPIRVVPLENVTKLENSDGTSVSKTETKKVEVTAWEVKSDSRKGGTYTVTREGSHFSCTCLGFTYRKSCRHTIAIKAKVA
jgi:hypothetical protein